MTDTGPSASPAGHRLGLLAPSFLLVGIMLCGPVALMGLFSVWRFVPGKITDYSLTLSNYARLLGDGFYLGVIGQTLQLAFGVTLLSIVLGYPLAFYLARTKSRFQPLLLNLVFVPMMISLVVRA